LPEGIACGDFGRWIPFVPKESVDLLFLDPPYNLTKSFNGSTFARRGESEYTEWLRSVIGRIVPLLKRSATVYICGDWRTSYSIFDAAAEHLTIRNRITWEREKGRGAKANWKNASEDIWFCTVSDEHYFDVDRVKVRRRVIAPYKDSGGRPKDWDATAAGNFRDTHPSNLWTDISVPFWSMPENTNHPTQKPEKLLAKLLLASTRVGDYVLDPFLGSGTTAVVSRKLHRRCLGIEVNREYCLWALRRLELARSEPSIQGYEDGVFWERNTLRDRRRNRSFRRDRRPKSL
jgi:site-specific DNA-methyltransferase (adenine-specific)